MNEVECQQWNLQKAHKLMEAEQRAASQKLGQGESQGESIC